MNNPCRIGPLQRGVSLIELMVAMTIGLVLIYGASAVYLKSRATYSDNDAIARLQESARYALNALELDVHMAGYWGLYSAQYSGTTAITIGGQKQSLGAAVVAGGAGINYCGTNFAVDLNRALQGDNNGYLPASQGGSAGFLSNTVTSNCQPLNNKHVTTSDTLTVRRANASNTPTGILQICSTLSSADLVNDSSGCFNDGKTAQINDLLVHAYYVAQDSDQQTGLPSLRRKTITNVGGAPAFTDEEVIAGVDDMQVQFGIETNVPFTGVASRYVNADSPLLNPALGAAVQIISVRIWLLMRGETQEANFTDAKTYEYGDRLAANGTTGDPNNAAGAGKALTPSASSDATQQHYRRLVVSRTFQVRNAQTN